MRAFKFRKVWIKKGEIIPWTINSDISQVTLKTKSKKKNSGKLKSLGKLGNLEMVERLILISKSHIKGSAALFEKGRRISAVYLNGWKG